MSDLNDPRVFFAAERTLLAWTRTSLALTGFGFVTERFALVLDWLMPMHPKDTHGGLFLWVGLALIALGSLTACVSASQYRRVLKTLKPIEIPEGYRFSLGVWLNWAIAIIGIALGLNVVLAPGS